MSKITVTLDTETKELSMTINGVVYNDVRDITIYKDEYCSRYEGQTEEHISFSACLKSQKDGDVTTDTYLRSYASIKDKSEIIEKINDELVIAETKTKEQKKEQSNAEIKLKKHWSYES